jgi:hypothetical protein
VNDSLGEVLRRFAFDPLAAEEPSDETKGGLIDQNCARIGHTLKARGQIWGFSVGKRLQSRSDRTNDSSSRRNPDTDSELWPSLVGQARAQLRNRGHDFESSFHGSSGIVVMSLGKPEVNELPVP